MGKRTVRLFLTLVVMFQAGVSVVFATNVIYLMGRGVDLMSLGVLAAIFWTIQILAGVPAGALADVVSRKRAIVAAAVLCALGMFQYSRATGFAGCAAAETLLSLGFALANGSLQAWLVDSLKEAGREDLTDGTLAGQQQALALANLVGSVVGVHLAAWDERAPWLVGGATFLLAAATATIAMGEKRSKEAEFALGKTFSAFAGKIASGASKVKTDRAVRTVMILAGLQFMAVQAMNMQWQPRFLPLLPDKTWLGYLFASGAALTVLGAAVSGRAARIFQGRRRLAFLAQIAVGATLLAAGIPDGLALAALCFVLNQSARGLFLPTKDSWLNGAIDPDDRATMLSFEATSRSVGIVLGLLVWGFLAERVSISVAWISAGAFLVVTTLVLAATERHG